MRVPTGSPSSLQIGTNPMFSSFMRRAQARAVSSGRQHFADFITVSTVAISSLLARAPRALSSTPPPLRRWDAPVMAATRGASSA